MITHLHCTICPDLKKAKSTLSDMQRINISLKTYVKKDTKFNPKYNITNINVRVHPHFMCGKCVEFNENKLRNVEKEIHNKIYSICCNIKDGLLSDNEIRNVLKLITNNYPSYHAEIIRQWHLKRKNETEEKNHE